MTRYILKNVNNDYCLGKSLKKQSNIITCVNKCNVKINVVIDNQELIGKCSKCGEIIIKIN